MAGADVVNTVIGPISTSISGVKLFMKTIIDAKPWLVEPALVPLPWNSFPPITHHQPLKIGVMWHDETVKPHPPIIRALREVVSRLRTISNISIVDWKPHVHNEAWVIISSLYFTDGGKEDSEVIAESGEPWRPLTTWIIKENPCAKKMNMHELAYWIEEREAYRKEHAKVWNDTAIGQNSETGELEGMVDVILCPVGPGVAPRHDTAKYWPYTSQWNLLDYPALAFPVSKVDSNVDLKEKRFEPMSDLDKVNYELCKLLSLHIPKPVLMIQKMIQRNSTVYQYLYNWLEEGSRMRRCSRYLNTFSKRSVCRLYHSHNMYPEPYHAPESIYILASSKTSSEVLAGYEHGGLHTRQGNHSLPECGCRLIALSF
jgi:hypothetical protein